MRIRHLFCAVAVAAGLALSAAADTKGTLAGRVVDARGKGIAGARVVASGDAEVEGTTDEKGDFRLELEPGEYRLRFEADGYASSSLRGAVTIRPGRQTKLDDRVELPESDEGSVVRGSVFDVAGRSVSGAKVVLERVAGEGGEAPPPLRMEARSDSIGMFAFRVPKGEARYRLTATRDKLPPATVTVDVYGGEIVNAPPLTLEAGGARE